MSQLTTNTLAEIKTYPACLFVQSAVAARIALLENTGNVLGRNPYSRIPYAERKRLLAVNLNLPRGSVFYCV